MLYDIVIAVASLFGLGWFLYIVASFVAEPDLYVVCVMIYAVAIYFIVRDLKENAGKMKVDTKEHPHPPA